MSKSLDKIMKEMKEMVKKDNMPIMCVGVGAKPMTEMLHLVKPHPMPLCIMSDKTSGIEPVFTMTAIKRRINEDVKKEGFKFDLRRVIRETSDT